MRSITLVEAERSSKVLLEKRGLLDLSKQSLVDVLLIGNSLGLDFLLGSLVTEELLLGSRRLGLLLSSKVGNVELGSINGRDINLGGSGDHISGVDSSNGDTVNLEGARDQQSVVLQRLQVNNSLASESASKDDQNSTGYERRSKRSGLSGLSSSLRSRGRLSGIPLLGLVLGDNSFTTVVGL